MTSASELYRVIGQFWRSGTVALDTDSGESTTELIAGISGKRIIPAWILIAMSGTTDVITYSLHGGNSPDANFSNYLIYKESAGAQYFDRKFRDFDGRELMTLADGEGLSFTFHADTGLDVAANTAYCSVGYYLSDA